MARQRRTDRTALDLVEEAARLLRSAPGGVLLRYYIGSAPFILGVLYFFTDMARGAYAATHVIEASLGIAALYLWMKCWHAAFASGLRSDLARETPAPWTAARIWRLFCVQAAVQPSGLFLRIFAAIALLPYPWVYGFYQGVGVFGDGTTASIREVSRRAWSQAQWQPMQAAGALAYLKVFAFFVWLNVMVFTFFAPQLLRMFTGIETVFTLSPDALMNTTVLLSSLGVTYLCFDPLRKALYVLRCFHGESVRTGEDLAVELKSLRAPLTAALLLLLFCAPFATAAEPPPRIDSAQLSESIEEVLQRREYTWRLPRGEVVESDKSGATLFIEEFFNSIRRKWEQFQEWRRKRAREAMLRGGGDGEFGGFGLGSRGILYTAIALTTGLIVYFLWKRRRDLRVNLVAAQAIANAPDLRDEDVTADQLPEDGWLRLARDLMEQGELRLALRASYLAGLAHLGQRQLIVIARHKTNFDYERELRRRARSREELLTAFDANLDAFERAWYGLHEVTRDTLGGFNANLEKIRAC